MIARSVTGLITRFIGLWLLVIMLPPSAAQSHPHAWIDIATRVVLDDQGRITSIEQEWLFDEIYSAFVIEDTQGSVSKEALNDLARNNLSNLRAHDYFTEVRQAGEKVALGTVEQWASEMREGRLWMSFTVPMRTPVDPRAGHIRYAVFDPSYWVEMAYADGDTARIVSATGNDNGCSLMHELPVVTGGMLAFALSLDRDEEAPENLGAQFATWVEVLCP